MNALMSGSVGAFDARRGYYKLCVNCILIARLTIGFETLAEALQGCLVAYAGNDLIAYIGVDGDKRAGGGSSRLSG